MSSLRESDKLPESSLRVLAESKGEAIHTIRHCEKMSVANFRGNPNKNKIDCFGLSPSQ